MINSILIKETKLMILLSMMLCVILSSILAFSFAVFIMQLFLASITFPMIIKRDYKIAKLYLIIFIISLIFVFLIYIANNLYYGSPYYIGGSDDINFENEGRLIINSGMISPSKILESGIIGKWHNATFYSVYISILIKISDYLGGYSTFLPRILNIYFLIWCCILLEYLLKKYANFTTQNTYISIALFSLTPNVQYINSHVFRDTFNLLQILLIIYLFDKLFSNKNYTRKILYIALLAFLIYITYYTRKNALAFAGAVCIFIIGEKFRINKIYIIIFIILIVVMGNVLGVMSLSGFIESYRVYVLGIAGDGLSRYVFGQSLLPWGIFLRAFYAFIIPFPNFFRLFKDPTKILFDLVSFLIYLGVLIQILVIPFIIKRIIKFDWLSLSFLSWFLAVIISTFTFRHVILYYPFMVAVAVDGYLNTPSNNRKLILFLSGISAFCFGLIYISLKLFL